MKPISWLVIWTAIIELLVIVFLVPGSWVDRVIQDESALLEKRLGSSSYIQVHEKATGWFNSTLIDSGYYRLALNLVVPTEEQKANSQGMERLGEGWFRWCEGRVRAVATLYYQVLMRLAGLAVWAPYLLILLVPTVYDGIMVVRIKRAGFVVDRPVLHWYTAMGMVGVGVLLVGLLVAPVVLDPAVIFFALMLACVLIGLVMGSRAT